MKILKKKCGECGYFMRYNDENYGDCGSITMNKECNEGINPFREDYVSLLQVDSDDDACGLLQNTAQKE